MDGVIGYQATTLTPPKTLPKAPASLPVMSSSPSVAFMGATRYGSRLSRFSAAQSNAARTTCTFGSTSLRRPPNCTSSAASTTSSGTPSSQATTPT